MADETEEKPRDSVAGYSGSPYEGQGPSEPPSNVTPSENAVISPAGVTEPPQVFKGDGITPADAETPPPENAEPGPATGIPEGEEPPPGSVISPAGVTPPTQVFKGDGVTPANGEPTEPEDGEPEPEAEQASYEDFTVAELKDQAESRGIEVKYDWIKGDIIKALKKADKAEGK